jgi:hypothetical protein
MQKGFDRSFHKFFAAIKMMLNKGQEKPRLYWCDILFFGGKAVQM